VTVEHLLGERFGMRIDGSTRARLDRLLAEGARLAGLDATGYEHLLQRDERALTWLVERLTVQETEFFRHPAQFDVIARVVRSRQAGVAWSAGCANGQEAWSLAMLLEELGAGGWSVLGTDLSAEAVARASAGVYGERELRGLSAGRRARFLRPRPDGGFEVAASLRGRVRFARHNLVTQPPPLDADGRLVLCRNVLIYLRPDDAGALLARLRERMPPDGALLIGAAESLPADHPSFMAEREDGVYVYRPRPTAAREPLPVPDAPPAPPPRRPRPRAAIPPVEDLIAAGERHAAAGRHREAAAAFRKAAYLRPGDALAHARLGFALEAGGDARAARRAFRAAGAALARTDPDALAGRLGGWSADELARVVAERSRRLGAA
jgi:chemotaxis methyl-accepting protein methylase